MHNARDSSSKPPSDASSQRLSPLLVLLVMGWALLPAVQYFATLQRTQLFLQREPAYPQLISLDLLWGYVALLVASLLYVAWQFHGNRKRRQSVP